MKIFGINITRHKPVNLADKKADTKEPGIKGKNRRKLSQKILRERRLDIDVEMETFLQAVNLAKDIERPDRKPLLAIYEKISDRDSHLLSQLRTARFTVQQSDFQILLNDTENKELKKLFETGWFTDFITYAIDQEFYGHSLIEFGQLIDGIFKDVSLIFRDNVIPEFQSVLLETTDDITDGIPYADNLDNWFLVEVGSKRYLGLLMTAAIDIIYKNDARTDWASFNERFGMPLLSITTDTSNDDELDELENMAIHFGSNGYVIGSQETEIDVKQATGTENGHKKYADKIELCDSYISKLINGQTSTSDEKSYVGSAEVQERVLNTYTKGRLQRIQRIINDKLIPFLIYHGYPLEGAKFQYIDLLKKEVKETVTDTDTEKKKSELKLNDDLTEFYTLLNENNNIEFANSDKLKKIFDNLTKRLHEAARKDKLPKDDELLKYGESLLKETALTLEKAMNIGFSLSVSKPDADFTEKLTKSAWVFSGFKTNRQLKDISSKLFDGKKVKPFNKFRDEVLSVHKNYNANWLSTEYNQAVSASLQASNWKLYEKGADRYYLQYRTAGDERVRGSHKALNEITLPMSHSFWDEHYPPNGWGCRCGQKQVLKSSYKQTDEAEVTKKTENFFNEKEKIFAYNSGKTGALFPNKHPYYNVLKRYESIKQASINNYLNEHAKSISIKKYPNGGESFENILIDKKASDYKDLSIISDEFAKLGERAEIMPELHYKSDIYKHLFKGAYERKNPDLKIGNVFYEYKSYTGKFTTATIKKMISRAVKQSNYIIIDNTGGASENYIIKQVENRIRQGQNIKEVWTFSNGKIKRIFKKTKA